MEAPALLDSPEAVWACSRNGLYRALFETGSHNESREGSAAFSSIGLDANHVCDVVVRCGVYSLQGG